MKEGTMTHDDETQGALPINPRCHRCRKESQWGHPCRIPREESDDCDILYDPPGEKFVMAWLCIHCMRANREAWEQQRSGDREDGSRQGETDRRK